MFSIIIPTWNNLELLKLCISSLHRHTTLPIEIVLHVNEGSDGTLDWVRSEGILHTYSPENIGICHAVNQAAALSTRPYLVYLNDDMVCCPGWDTVLMNCIRSLGTDAFMLSGTMIEPRETGNPCVIVRDYGNSPETFRETAMLRDLPQPHKSNWYGATWPPTVVHRDWWVKVGGYSPEFSPGISSDNDFSMKLWAAGCRIFLGLGASRVYHFMSRSTGKVVRNDGRKQFLLKWGMTQSTFDRHFLRRGQRATLVRLPEPEKTLLYYWDLLRGKVKRIWA
ncbi:MAG: glycosyltransferase [Betaproteobacteria bacterium]|nr:glycosyltransferase [Betaproteobacteria bacterium]